MFNTWLALQQLTEALRQGRLDEACRLARQPAVRGHQRAGELIPKLTDALLDRSRQHRKRGDSAAAWQDVRLAEEVGDANNAAVAQQKQELTDTAVRDVRAALDAGQPNQAVQLLDEQRRRGVQAAPFAPLEEVARAWLVAVDLAARGELAQAQGRIDAVPYRPFAPLAELRADLARRRDTFQDKLETLHDAVEARRWREVVRLADDLLALAPEHPEIRKARTKAWKALEPPTLVYAGPRRSSQKAEGSADLKFEVRPSAAAPAPVAAPAPPEPPRRVLMWVDGVGGFLVCLAPRISIGQAIGDAAVDVPLQADVSRLHAYLSRDEEGYLLEAVRPVLVNGKATEKTLLRDGDVLTLGKHCQLRFRQPLAVSGTARLELVSKHRLPLSLDGVLLLAEACLMGDNADAHVVVPGLKTPVALVRHKDGLAVQSAASFQVDDAPGKGRVPVTLHSTVAGEDFRLTLEPVERNKKW